MASLKDIKYKVVAIGKTKQITRAMNMVSTAKLRSAQRNAEEFSRYSKEYTSLLNQMIRHNPTYSNPLLVENSNTSTVGILLITPDRGLCGAFASSLLQKYKDVVDRYKKEGKDVLCYCIGRKGYDFAKKMDCSIMGYDIGAMSSIPFAKVQEIASILQEHFIAQNVGSIHIIHGHFLSLMAQEPCLRQLLPLVQEVDKDEEVRDILYEPSSRSILEEVIPRISAITIYNALLDTIVSEHAARMIAMNNATKNCDDLIASFSLLYNKVRQAAVTKELMDIVGGAEALNS